MNPLNLLNKGRTINGLKSRSGGYKLPSRNYLPNFSNPKPAVPTTPHPPREVTQPTFFDIPKPSVPAPPAPAPKPPATPKQPAPREPILNRLAAICREYFQRVRAARKMSPFQRPTIQTELALEKVTVVRNDLSEDDVEVIPVGKKEKRNKVADPPAISADEHAQCPALSTNR